jgi:hypothetical protein
MNCIPYPAVYGTYIPRQAQNEKLHSEIPPKDHSSWRAAGKRQGGLPRYSL